MPIYDYTCRACDHVFERLVRLPNQASRDEVISCPRCGSQDLQQMVSSFSVNSNETRKTHLNQARKLGQKEKLEKQHADMEYMAHHDD